MKSTSSTSDTTKTAPRRWARVPTGLYQLGLTYEQAAMAVILLSYCRPPEKLECFPGLATLTQCLGLPPSKNNKVALRITAELVSSGLVRVVETRNAKGNRVRGYDLTALWAKAVEATEGTADEHEPAEPKAVAQPSSTLTKSEPVRPTAMKVTAAPVPAPIKPESIAAPVKPEPKTSEPTSPGSLKADLAALVAKFKPQSEQIEEQVPLEVDETDLREYEQDHAWGRAVFIAVDEEVAETVTDVRTMNQEDFAAPSQAPVTLSLSLSAFVSKEDEPVDPADRQAREEELRKREEQSIQVPAAAPSTAPSLSLMDPMVRGWDLAHHLRFAFESALEARNLIGHGAPSSLVEAASVLTNDFVARLTEEQIQDGFKALPGRSMATVAEHLVSLHAAPVIDRLTGRA